MNWENVQYIEIHIIVVNNRKLLLLGLLNTWLQMYLDGIVNFMEEKLLILACSL